MQICWIPWAHAFSWRRATHAQRALIASCSRVRRMICVRGSQIPRKGNSDQPSRRCLLDDFPEALCAYCVFASRDALCALHPPNFSVDDEWIAFAIIATRTRLQPRACALQRCSRGRLTSDLPIVTLAAQHHL